MSKQDAFDPKIAYDLMALAHDVAHGQSVHPSNPIASVLHLASGEVMSSSNLWLHAFAPNYEVGIKVGRSSPTKHSEPAVIAKTSQQGLSTQGAVLYITDPLCPNCMCAVVAAGISRIYIDAQSFAGQGDWYRRRCYHFDTTSLQVAANAGVPVYKLHIDKKNKTAKRQGVNLPEPTQRIDFDNYYSLERLHAHEIDVEAMKSVLRTQLKLQSVGESALSRAAVTVIIPPKKAEDLTTVLSVKDVQIVKEADKNRALTNAMDQHSVARDRYTGQLNKYHAKISPLSHARSVLGKLGGEITQGTQIITSCVPTSHEVVNLCDVLDKIQLHVLDKKKTWMSDDKIALRVYKRIGAGLKKDPQIRKLSDVLSPIKNKDE